MTAPDTSALARLYEDPAARRIFAAIDTHGEETRIVGGAVRNALLSRDVHEIDFATTAPPDLVIARARAAELRMIPTGLDHGTVTLLVEGRPFEVTSLREDIDTDGRHAIVRFGRDFRVDAMRRDFTINALFLDKRGAIFDFTGGVEDIAARRVRFIGDPATRLREDYLRILRFFRFSADYGEGPIDREGLIAAMRERAGLARLSRERIRAELLKLVAARRAAEGVEEMSAAGLLGPLLGAPANPAALRRLVEAEPDADALLRLASLCLATAEDAERLGARLRLSNAEQDRLARAAAVIVALHGRNFPPSERIMRRLLLLHGRQAAVDGATLASTGEASADRRAAIDFLRGSDEPRLPFSGADLLAKGLSGRAVGEALRALRDHWIEAGFPDDASDLRRLLDRVVKDGEA